MIAVEKRFNSLSGFEVKGWNGRSMYAGLCNIMGRNTRESFRMHLHKVLH